MRKQKLKEVYHKKMPYTEDRYISYSSGKFILSKLRSSEDRGVSYQRMGVNRKVLEVIRGFTRYYFPATDKTKIKFIGLELFNMVRWQAIAYLKAHPKFRLPHEYPQMDFCDDPALLRARWGGFDLKHAYWRIAYNLGIIDQKTYMKGLNTKHGAAYKTARLQALSVLGQPRKYLKFRDGKPTGEVHIFGGDEKLRRLYLLIRLTCYEHMHNIQQLLGPKNYVGHITDAVYFKDLKRNWTLVKSYLEQHRLPYRELIQPSKEDIMEEKRNLNKYGNNTVKRK